DRRHHRLQPGHGEESPQSSAQQLRTADRALARIGRRNPAAPATVQHSCMTCAEFLDRYTDFRDGLITAPRELRRFERHLACCPACRRYDTAVRRGVRALQALE